MSAALNNETLVNQHKRSAVDFTRNRILSCKAVFTMLMSKGVKSLQLSLNELIPKLGLPDRTVSRVAYAKARKKLKYTFFMALNQEAVIRTVYEDGDYKTLHGFRVLAVDGSKVQLPTNPETKKVFGSFDYHSMQLHGKGPMVSGEHSYALASVLYDILNRVALDAVLAPSHSYEVELAKEHLKHTETNDLVIYDRGYCSFRMLAVASMANGHFLIRCTGRSFKVANDMLKGEGPDDIVTEIVPSQKSLRNPDNKTLPKTLTVRFVRVTLDSGEYEVLATSLLDQQQYPVAIFKEWYYLRWGIETFYGILKTRLNLENFSGYSVEAIQQDFHVAVLLTGVESILTEDTEEDLKKQHGGHPKKVNKAVSFNAIKDHAFELFMSSAPQDEVLEELEQLFKQNPTLERKDRKPPRKNPSSHRILGFWKRQRKMVF
jgi:hypothetical protein